MKNKIIFKTLMLKGEAGSTIVSMVKTGHVGTADIYTITFNDGSTTEISLENMSAITSVEMTSSTDTEDIYTITCADGSTQTFSVLNHNADIAAMSDDIDTIDARVDNFINSVVPNTVETLWTGSIKDVGDSATLSKAVSNFDYIDLYLLGSADSKYIRVPATQTAVQIQQQNLSDDASSNFLRLWEMGVSISGSTVSITKSIAWAWDDPNNSNPTVTANAQNSIPITRIDGVKVASDTPAEVIDIRVGADGRTYNSAGAAVRGQVSKLDYETSVIENNTLSFSDNQSITATGTESGAYWRLLNGTWNKASNQYWYIHEYPVAELTFYNIHGSRYDYTPVCIFKNQDGDFIGHTEIVDVTGNYERQTIAILTPKGTTSVLIQQFGTSDPVYCKTVIVKNKVESGLKGYMTVGNYGEPITVDLSEKTIKFPADTVVLINGVNYNISGIAQTISYSGLSTALKVGFDISNSTFVAKSYNQKFNTTTYLLFTARVSASAFYPDPYFPFKINNNLFGLVIPTNIYIDKGDFITICHQGYSETDSIGHNLLEGYPLAKQKGFDWGECDLKKTSDNVLVCCHDSTFVDQSTQETITISQHTLAELQTYNYYGGTIATFDDVVKTCKVNGLGLVIDQINFDNKDLVFPIVKKYGMQKRVAYLLIYNADYPDLITTLYNAIHTVDSDAHFMVIPSSTSIINDAVDFCNDIKTPTNKVELSLNYGTYSVNDILTIQQQLNSDVNVVVWTIDGLSTCQEYLPYVTAITSNKVSGADLFTH